MSSDHDYDFDVIVIGGGARRALRRRAGRRRPARGDRRARADRRGVLLLGVRPVQDAAASRRGARRGPRRPWRREAVSGPVDAPAALAWRDCMVSELRRRGPGGVGAAARGSTCCAATDARRSARRRRGREDLHRRAHRHRNGLGPGDPARSGLARARRRLDQPRGHRPHRGPAAAAGPRRRARRRRDGAGARAPGRFGGARGERRPRAPA